MWHSVVWHSAYEVWRCAVQVSLWSVTLPLLPPHLPQRFTTTCSFHPLVFLLGINCNASKDRTHSTVCVCVKSNSDLVPTYDAFYFGLLDLAGVWERTCWHQIFICNWTFKCLLVNLFLQIFICKTYLLTEMVSCKCLLVVLDANLPNMHRCWLWGKSIG